MAGPRTSQAQCNPDFQNFIHKSFEGEGRDWLVLFFFRVLFFFQAWSRLFSYIGESYRTTNTGKGERKEKKGEEKRRENKSTADFSEAPLQVRKPK